MRILFVSETYYPHLNGVYYFVCRLAPLLQERGHQVAVIAPSENTVFAKKRIDNIDVYVMPSLPIVVYPKLRFTTPLMLKFRIKGIIENFQPDVIHIQDHFILGKAVVGLNKKFNIPLIATNHFMPENLTSLVKNQTAKAMFEQALWARFSGVFNQAAIITTPTAFGAELIRPRLAKKVVPISSGIDLHQFNPPGQKPGIRAKYSIPDKPVLLYVGRLDPEKRIEEILEAVAVAVKQLDFCFVVVGKGLRKPVLEQLAKDLNIENNVVFTGFVPDEDLPYLYKLSRCFIIASRAELLSLVTLQAMACGLPVIAVNAGALTELVQEGENGYLFETGDAAKIVASLLHLFTNDALHNSMSQKSTAISKEHDIHKTVLSFEKLYQNKKRKVVVDYGKTTSFIAGGQLNYINSN